MRDSELNPSSLAHKFDTVATGRYGKSH